MHGDVRNPWEYRVAPELVPWSSKAHNPHREHLNNTAETAEFIARNELGFPAVLPSRREPR